MKKKIGILLGLFILIPYIALAQLGGGNPVGSGYRAPNGVCTGATTGVTTLTNAAACTLTVTGLTAANMCVCQPQTVISAGLALTCLATTNTATCEYTNASAGTITPTAVVFNVFIP